MHVTLLQPMRAKTQVGINVKLLLELLIKTMHSYAMLLVVTV